MNAIYLMEALTEIDAALIENAPLQQKVKRHTVGRIVLIAALIAVLVGSVFAVSETVSWFIGYYGNAGDGDMSKEQIQYIEDNTVQQYQEVDVEGYRVAVESTFSDGNVGIIKLKVTAPEYVKLNAKGGYTFQKKLIPQNSETKEPGSYSSMSYSTNVENVIEYVITIRGGVEDKSQWRLELQNLWATYIEQTDGKYRHRDEIVAIGNWSFDIVFSTSGNIELELLTKPILGTADMGIEEQHYVSVLFKSIKLRTMSMLINYENLDSPMAGIWFDGACIVMKDGTIFEFNSMSGSRNGLLVLFGEPLVFEDADYLLLPDGQKVPIT